MNTVLREHIFPNRQALQIVQGDITQEQVDAIVNAANESLMHGGGVAAVIARKGGRVVKEESRAWVQEHGRVSHESPAYTRAGELPCKYVIHAVGPVWGSGDEDTKLAAAVRGSLQAAEELRLTSIAFPAISTGIFGFPKEQAAGVIFGAVANYFDEQPDSGLALVRVTLYDQPTTEAFLSVWDRLFGEQ